MRFFWGTNKYLVDISAPNKIFSPPPKKSPIHRRHPPGLSAPPGDPRPFWDFQLKKFPPPRQPRTPPSPSPSRKKKYPKRPPSKVILPRIVLCNGARKARNFLCNGTVGRGLVLGSGLAGNACFRKTAERDRPPYTTQKMHYITQINSRKNFIMYM